MMRFSLHSFQRQCGKDISRYNAVVPPGGGTTTDTFVYTGNHNLDYPGDGCNVWKTKTAQSLPDHSQIVVYSNYAGLPMLRVNVDHLGNMWATFFRYRDDGQVMWEAHPSAVALPIGLGTLEKYNDLLAYNPGTGLYTYLNSTGLIKVINYYTTDNPSVGAFKGKVSGRAVQKGQSGTPIQVSAITYTSNTDTSTPSITIYPVASTVDYPSDAGIIPTITTGYSYTFATNTNYLTQRITSLPAVSSGQAGDALGQVVRVRGERVGVAGGDGGDDSGVAGIIHRRSHWINRDRRRAGVRVGRIGDGGYLYGCTALPFLDGAAGHFPFERANARIVRRIIVDDLNQTRAVQVRIQPRARVVREQIVILLQRTQADRQRHRRRVRLPHYLPIIPIAEEGRPHIPKVIDVHAQHRQARVIAVDHDLRVIRQTLSGFCLPDIASVARIIEVVVAGVHKGVGGRPAAGWHNCVVTRDVFPALALE